MDTHRNMPYRRGADTNTMASREQTDAMPSDSDVCYNQNLQSSPSTLRNRFIAHYNPKMKIQMESVATKAERRKAMLKDVSLAALLFSIVCFCYIVYQYLQELLMKVTVVGAKRFDYPVFIVCICFAVNLVTTSILMGGMQLKLNRDYRDRMLPQAERKTVFDMLDWKISGLGMIAATSNVMAMTMSLIAIKYIGVPSQIIIKSAKMIPILIGGFVLFRKKYPLYDYVSIIIITICIFLFNFFKDGSKESKENTPFGLTMCFMSLLMDGITGPIEDKMLALKDLHPYLLLFILNFFGFPVAVIVTLAAEGTEPIIVLLENPQLWYYLLLLSVTASIGQVFIVLCLKFYGSLYTTMITTVRKIVSSLLSIYTFKHPMSVVQWLSMAGTFVTLMVRQLIKYKAGQKKASSQTNAEGKENKGGKEAEKHEK